MVVSTCTSLMANGIEHFPYICEAFVYLLLSRVTQITVFELDHMRFYIVKFPELLTDSQYQPCVSTVLGDCLPTPRLSPHC